MASRDAINSENGCFQMLSTDYNVENLVAEVAEKDGDIEYLIKVLRK